MKKLKMPEKLKKMKLSNFGKRQLILAGLIVMIAVAGYINLHYNAEETVPTVGKVADVQEQPPKATEAPKTDAFVSARLDKENSRSASMDVYREIINNPNSSEDAKVKAESDLAACAKAIENEAILENMVKSKGFSDVMVYIASDGVNVVVKSNGLQPQQVAQIKDLVVETTGFEASKIKIAEID